MSPEVKEDSEMPIIARCADARGTTCVFIADDGGHDHSLNIGLYLSHGSSLRCCTMQKGELLAQLGLLKITELELVSQSVDYNRMLCRVQCRNRSFYDSYNLSFRMPGTRFSDVLQVYFVYS